MVLRSILLLLAVMLAAACEEAVEPEPEPSINGSWLVSQYVVSGHEDVNGDYAFGRTIIIRIDDRERGFYEEQYRPARSDGITGRRFAWHNRPGHKLLVLTAVSPEGALEPFSTEVRIDGIQVVGDSLSFRILSWLQHDQYSRTSITTNVRARRLDL